MGIPILVRRHLYIETAPRYLDHRWMSICHTIQWDVIITYACHRYHCFWYQCPHVLSHPPDLYNLGYVFNMVITSYMVGFIDNTGIFMANNAPLQQPSSHYTHSIWENKNMDISDSANLQNNTCGNCGGFCVTHTLHISAKYFWVS